MDQPKQKDQSKRMRRMARLARAKEENRSFDLIIWNKVGAEGKFEAAWQMVSEVNALKGKEADKPRLQRSIQSIQRIKNKAQSNPSRTDIK